MEKNENEKKIQWIKRIRTTDFYQVQHILLYAEDISNNADAIKINDYLTTTIINSNQIVRIYSDVHSPVSKAACIKLTYGKLLFLGITVDEVAQLL